MPSAFPGIPAVVDDRVLAPSVRALVEAVEIMTGQRSKAPGELRIVTQNEADKMKADIAQIKAHLGLP